MYASGLVAHVFVATLAFGFAITLDFVLVAVARSRQVNAIRSVYETTSTYGRLIGPMFGIAILLGFALALGRHESLVQPWLIVSYILVVLGTASGILVGRRRAERILAAARSAGDSMTPELDQAIAEARPLGAWVMIVLMLALIAVMFLKPFSSQ